MECNFQTLKFPAGEVHVRLLSIPERDVHVNFNFDNGSDDIVELLLLYNALKHCHIGIDELRIGYMPFGRQDRIAVKGESLSIEVMASLINSVKARRVIIIDPHSDVITALIKNCDVINQCDIFKPYFIGKNGFYLISPDGGALKKIYQLAKQVDCLGVIECSKTRDVKTGEISGVIVHSGDLSGRDCYIVDDICDGGKTFIEIAKILKLKNCGKITLMVSHGLFTKRIDVFDGYIDAIITKNGNLCECSDDII